MMSLVPLREQPSESGFFRETMLYFINPNRSMLLFYMFHSIYIVADFDVAVVGDIDINLYIAALHQRLEYNII